MATPTTDDIFRALTAAGVPAGMADVHLSGADVTVALSVDPAQGTALETLRQAAETALLKIKGIGKTNVLLTSEKKSAPDPHGMHKNPPLSLPVRRIIAVGSGKGGVGKSTVAFNLALALSRAGQNVGLLDADIYGPSIPKLSGLEDQKPHQESGKIIPLSAHGIKIMSIGFMVEPEKALIWRGPMAQSALYQMLRDVEWAPPNDPLDTLLIDLPPGTGDIQLTMIQKVPLAGAVIVSTPQDLALIDARKAIAMFQKMNIPILGLIENMSTYACTNCGHEAHIFGHGGAKTEALKLGVPFLGHIPLRADIRENSDNGIAADENLFTQIAAKIL